MECLHRIWASSRHSISCATGDCNGGMFAPHVVEFAPFAVSPATATVACSHRTWSSSRRCLFVQPGGALPRGYFTSTLYFRLLQFNARPLLLLWWATARASAHYARTPLFSCRATVRLWHAQQRDCISASSSVLTTSLRAPVYVAPTRLLLQPGLGALARPPRFALAVGRWKSADVEERRWKNARSSTVGPAEREA